MRIYELMNEFFISRKVVFDNKTREAINTLF